MCAIPSAACPSSTCSISTESRYTASPQRRCASDVYGPCRLWAPEKYPCTFVSYVTAASGLFSDTRVAVLSGRTARYSTASPVTHAPPADAEIQLRRRFAALPARADVHPRSDHSSQDRREAPPRESGGDYRVQEKATDCVQLQKHVCREVSSRGHARDEARPTRLGPSFEHGTLRTRSRLTPPAMPVGSLSRDLRRRRQCTGTNLVETIFKQNSSLLRT